MNKEVEFTAPLFFPPTTLNQVEMSLVEEKEAETSRPRRRLRSQKPLLVRSLSMASEREEEHRTRRLLALKSLSETCLSSSFDSSSCESTTYYNNNSVLPPELIATNVDDEDDVNVDDEMNICTCGCGVALTASAAGSKDDEFEFESEDEGCYFVTTTKPSDSPISTSREEGSHEHEGKAGAIVVDSVQVKSSPLQKANLAQASAVSANNKTSSERRSFSLSVDSGRSSNTGTLGHASTASKFSSSASASSSGDEDTNHHSVEIVSHTFCDFLDNRSKREDLPEEEVDDQEEGNHLLQQQQGTNKVSVFVPYSAITDLRRRESIALVNNPRKKAASSADVFGSADNVVICDTQVILRINSQPQKQQGEEEEDEVEKVDESKSTKYSRRMARRMTTTVAVYEMVKAKSEGSKAEIDAEDEGEEDQVSGSGGSMTAQPTMNKSQPAQFTTTHHRRRRKDLCKLLGLIECDVTTDATNPDDIQMARKVALENLISAIEAKHEGKVRVVAEEEQVNHHLAQETPLTPRKKDLAKFLGIEESNATNSSTPNPSHQQHSVQSVDETINKKSSNSNNRPFLRMMKNTIKWNHSKSATITSVSSDKNAEKNNNGDLEELLDVYQLKKANDVIFGSLNKSHPPNQDTANRTNRKNLNKYLGLDDSDSDEMVFIQNRKNKPSMGDNDSSLNRSEQGSSSGVVSVIGIKIDPVDDDGICDDIIASNSSTYSSSPTSSTLDLRPRTRRKASLNNFLRHSSSRLKSNQGFDKNNTSSKEEDEEDFSPPPRKSVLFKEYDFSVEESIATGFPVIPNINNTNCSSMHSSTSSSSRKIERKKKKDAAKRSAEILSSSHRRQRGLEHHFNCPPPPPPPPPPPSVQQISECCDECRGKNMHIEDDSFSSSSEQKRTSNSKQKRVKVQRGAMVRRHRLLIPENGGDPIFLGAQAQPGGGGAAAAHVPLMAVPQAPPPPAHAHYFPQMIPATHVVSYPNGRVRVVPWHYQHIQQQAPPMSRQQRRDLMDLQELKKVFQP